MADEKLVEAVKVVADIAKRAYQAALDITVSERLIKMDAALAALSPSQPAAPEQARSPILYLDCTSCRFNKKGACVCMDNTLCPGLKQIAKPTLSADVEQALTDLWAELVYSTPGGDIKAARALTKFHARLSALLPAPATAEDIQRWVFNELGHVLSTEVCNKIIKSFSALRSEPAEWPTYDELRKALWDSGAYIRDEDGESVTKKMLVWLSTRCQPRQRLTREQITSMASRILSRDGDKTLETALTEELMRHGVLALSGGRDERKEGGMTYPTMPSRPH